MKGFNTSMSTSTKYKTVSIELILKLKYIFLFSFGIISSNNSFAFPEYVQHGYFGCASCHASPTGGVMLLDYGRSVLGEKITTWSTPGEEGALWGAVQSKPEALLIGGQFRWAQVHVDHPAATDGKFFTMQKELELGVHLGSFWAVATGRKGGNLRDREDKDAKLGQFFVRYDVNDEWMLRVGRFLPRFGLMIPQHTPEIKKSMGNIPSEEADVVEATYSTETTESSLFAFKPRDLEDEDKTSGTGLGGNFSYFLFGKHRLGVTAHSTEQDVGEEKLRTQKLSLSGAFSMSEHGYVLVEMDRKSSKSTADQAKTTTKEANFVKAGIEVYKGVVPYALLETSMDGPDQPESKMSTYAFGLDWHPRPHLHLEGQFGHTLVRRDFSYANAGYLIMHVYL